MYLSWQRTRQLMSVRDQAPVYCKGEWNLIQIDGRYQIPQMDWQDDLANTDLNLSTHVHVGISGNILTNKVIWLVLL